MAHGIKQRMLSLPENRWGNELGKDGTACNFVIHLSKFLYHSKPNSNSSILSRGRVHIKLKASYYSAFSFLVCVCVFWGLGGYNVYYSTFFRLSTYLFAMKIRKQIRNIRHIYFTNWWKTMAITLRRRLPELVEN